MPAPQNPQTPTSLSVSTKGDVPAALKELARSKFAALPDRVRDPILKLEVRLISEANPSLERPAAVEAVADLDGEPVRARAEAAHLSEAIDIAIDHLVRRLHRAEDRRHRRPERRNGNEAGHEWRHGRQPRQPLPYFPRPVADREVVRRKSFELNPITVDEAAFDLDQLGHDFYLFTELSSGRECVLFEDEGSLRLLCDTSHQPDVARCAVAVQVHGIDAPTATVSEAEEWLDVSEEPFVFFRSAETGRGNVLYRRLDGHYGLISPA